MKIDRILSEIVIFKGKQGKNYTLTGTDENGNSRIY